MKKKTKKRRQNKRIYETLPSINFHWNKIIKYEIFVKMLFNRKIKENKIIIR